MWFSGSFERPTFSRLLHVPISDIFLAVMVWQDTALATLSSKKRSISNAKTSHTPTREIRAGDNLMLLARPNKDGGIVHALQPQIVPEIIACIDQRTHYWQGDGICQRWGANLFG